MRVVMGMSGENGFRIIGIQHTGKSVPVGWILVQRVALMPNIGIGWFVYEYEIVRIAESREVGANPVAQWFCDISICRTICAGTGCAIPVGINRDKVRVAYAP